MVEMLAMYAMRSMLQDLSSQNESLDLTRMQAVLHTPCVHRLLSRSDEYQLLFAYKSDLDLNDMGERELKYLDQSIDKKNIKNDSDTVENYIT